ncbi:2-amino-4-hydroxy-6-hydroxymethyldihydropteridine diphosphokinase [Jeotgalibacillus soli]|uniref:2-amino-4-hydroxy-6-hydroxymethyldihydropteridine diphosphokinase n=1 Tax=Jeotgalibacillus soli TaxID=889306 RepID=A0A0C2W7J6_9BACL|nr:2-amino-4-hydroxy-6-hydroxymethyldihydropteridine diphosphokinase [Jeotgalibacillus soli]KIL52541.1 2-amino-4-hydroxy-6-hydroxymethyldihydropteridine pyrophosphokinase [Jeotgalibacillus soli]
MTSIAYLSLGSNMGDRLTNLKAAVRRLRTFEEIDVTAVSSIYETDPVGFTDQEAFLNMVLEVKTSLIAEELFQKCLQVEAALGRERMIRWGPRTIDLDILLYNDDDVESENLIIPHPRMHERSFVLIPLLDVNPALEHPVLKKQLKEIFQALEDHEGVRLWKLTQGRSVSAFLEG